MTDIREKWKGKKLNLVKGGKIVKTIVVHNGN